MNIDQTEMKKSKKLVVKRCTSTEPVNATLSIFICEEIAAPAVGP